MEQEFFTQTVNEYKLCTNNEGESSSYLNMAL